MKRLTAGYWIWKYELVGASVFGSSELSDADIDVRYFYLFKKLLEQVK
jgi:hypothetical protein